MSYNAKKASYEGQIEAIRWFADSRHRMMAAQETQQAPTNAAAAIDGNFDWSHVSGLSRCVCVSPDQFNKFPQTKRLLIG